MRWIIVLVISCLIVFTGCSDDRTNDNNPSGDTDTGLHQGEDASSDADADADSDADATHNGPDTSQDVDPSTSCATNEDCSGSSSVCDPMSSLCVDCLFDSQCTDGGRCIERVCKTEGTCESEHECASVAGKTTCNQALRECVASCNNSLDCEQGDVCDPVQNQCVQCASNLDCGHSERCVDSQCEAYLACRSDNQCTPHGLLCNVERGACSECEDDAACPNAYHCAAGRCVVDLCETDTMRCSNRNVETCVDGKTFETIEVCPFQQSCIVKDNVASCGSCTTNDQCAHGFACSEGQCIQEIGESCPTAVAKARVATTTEYSHGSLPAKPLQTVEFSGLDSEGDSALTYEWTILTRPRGSKTQFSSNVIASPTLWLDLAGDYEIELIVYDADGVVTCASSTLKIHVVPDQAIHIQLTWSTPTVPEPGPNRGTDMDLHYRHPLGNAWNDARYDIYWKNSAQNWGTAVNPSRVTLDIDDLWGATTENINHVNPQDGITYNVGVHYFSDNGFGPADATIRIYIQGELMAEYLDQRMAQKYFWHVANIEWPGGIVSEINNVACETTFPGFHTASPCSF